jgi:hypothetical protein
LRANREADEERRRETEKEREGERPRRVIEKSNREE